MNSFKFLLFTVFSIFVFYTEGVAQTGNSQPKIYPKSVSTSVKTTSKTGTKRIAKTGTKYVAKAAPTPSNVPRIKFDNMFLDLGTLKEDAVLEKSFEFTNVGEKPLVIIDAKGSCGCTIPTAPTEPILPGGKGKILIKYTAKNKVGPQKPVVTVTTNGVPSVIKLNMEAWVEQIPGGVN